ncbi:hypothetical protein EET67_09865 [Pseudaminobacter arsenicus]|uniref:Uncharacterized protein n=1 Tax=Borborobacter arsenicus TaxID=1851146 RepID=A0A432V6X2_9HYPH|nr:hypothetical protein [Pseudaminobacter arsenicus]RUM97911.1 hypothetical protein EET67_09865 [Pseudaminobacter arsenicus]
MTPARAIAMLDRQLAAHGEKVVMRRYTASSGSPRPKTDISNVSALVRAIKAEELVGGIDMTASTVVLSPTGLAALLPLKKGDKVVIQGRERNVELPKPIFVHDTLVRITLLVTG